jgi:uncharacterized protein (DUF433 family)
MKPELDIYGGKNPADLPAYGPGLVAAYLRLPDTTVRYWVLGRDKHAPVIRIADPEARLLSFNDLIQVHVLKAVTRKHKVSLQEVRQFVEYLQEQFQSQRPLLDERMLTDGKCLYVEKLGALLHVSNSLRGQVAMTQVLDRYLARIKRDVHGIPFRLHPFTWPDDGDDPKLVMIDAQIQFGKPCITETGIPTAVVAERWKAGDSAELIAKDFDRKVIEIEEAVRYETELRIAA